MQRAVLMIAHGSREAQANADLLELAAELRRRAVIPIVEPAFLELVEPTIDQGASRCVEQGADCVLLVPYFLSAGTHVCRDLQRHCARLGQCFPNVTFHLAQPLGRHPLLADIVLQRAEEAWDDANH